MPQFEAMEPAEASVLPTDALPQPDFATIFEQGFDYVWFTLRRLGVAERDLEDISHEVFIQVFKHLGRFDPRRPLRPWLFGFAYRMASDYRSLARHRVESLGEHAEAVDTSPSAVDHLATRQELALVWTALAELDLDRRAIFLLHEVDGCSIPDVAASLDIPLNTAYSRLRLAREQFTKSMQRLRLRRGGT